MNAYSYLQKRADNNSLTPEAFDNFSNTEEGKKALGEISSGEVALTTAGAGLGGLAGFLLSKRYNRNATAATRILHSLAGATAGGIGAQLLLHAIKDPETGMTLSDKFRIDKAQGTEALENAINDSVEKRGPSTKDKVYTAISMGAGGVALGSSRNLVRLPSGASRFVNKTLHKVTTPIVKPLVSAKYFLGSHLARKSSLASSKGGLSTHLTGNAVSLNRATARAASKLSRGIRAVGKGSLAYGAGALLGYAVDGYLRNR